MGTAGASDDARGGGSGGLVDAGYDDVQFFLEMSDDKIETILTEAGMAKVGHRKRFVSCVRKLRAAAA